MAFAAPVPDNDSDLPIESTITNPDWVRLPTGDEMSRYYPALPKGLSLSGSVRMTCAVNVSGSLYDCHIVSEAPAGLGFGQAALRMTPVFKMKPQTIDGAPVNGAKVLVPVHFIMPTPPAAPPAGSLAAGPAVDPHLLELARRMVDEGGAGPLIDRASEALVSEYRAAANRSGVPTNPGTPGAEIVDDWRQAFASARPILVDSVARLYAAKLSEQQITQTLAFLESPVGKAFVAADRNVPQALVASLPAAEPAITAEARRRFCAKTECGSSAAQPAAKAGK